LGVVTNAVKLAMNLEFGDSIKPFKLFAFRFKANAKMNFGIVVQSFDLDLVHRGIWMEYFFLRKMAAVQR
jgi:hypothetical protein